MPIFSQSRDFVVKNGVITEGTAEATSSTGGSNIIQSGGGIAAAKNLVVGTSATIYGDIVGFGNTRVKAIYGDFITATVSVSTLLDLNVRNIVSTGTITGLFLGSVSTATSLVGGTTGQIPYQSAPSTTLFFGGSGTEGNLLISNGAAAPQFKNTLTLTGSTISTNTNTGALVVQGGAGIWGNLYVGGNLYSNNNQQVITTATVNSYANQTILTAGTDTAISTSTGNITIWNTSTLQSITNRGSTTNNAITITNATQATSTNTGALIVQGGIGLNGNLYVGGTLTAGNIIGSITLATTATNLAGGTAGQLHYQSAPGITSFAGPGTSGDILISQGTSGPTFANILTLSGTTAATNTTTGALQVRGGVGIGGSLYLGQSLAVSGTTQSSSTSTGALTVVGGVGIGKDLYVGGTINGTLNGTASYTNNINGGSAGSIPIQNASGVTSFIPIGTVGYVLSVSAGNTATWVNAGALTSGVATTATNIASGSAGQIVYQITTGTTGFVGPGTAGDILVSNGTSAPTYNNTLTLNATTQATNTMSGVLQVRGGAGIGKDLYVGGNQTISGNLTINSVNASTSTKSANSLYLQGGAYIDQSLVVEQGAIFKGPVTFSGTATYAYSTNTVFSDNLINVHIPPGSTGTTNHTWTIDDGKDIGFIFHYYKTQDKDAFLGLANDTGFLEWYDNGTESGGIFTGTSYGIIKTGGIRLVGGVANSGNSTSGDLQVTGGAGIGGGLYVGGTTTVAGNVLPSGTITLGSTGSRFNNLFLSASNSAINIGGVTLGSDGSATILAPNATFTATTAATSTNSGALQVVGGAGVGGNLYVGGIINVSNSTASSSPSTGALVVSGGLGVGGNLNVSGSTVLGSTASSAVVVGFISNNSTYATYSSPIINNTVQQVLDTFSTSTFRTAKYIVQITDGAKYHAQEMLLFHDNTQVYKTEYAIVYNNSELGTFDADISGGSARLLFTANVGVASLVVKLVRTTITL